MLEFVFKQNVPETLKSWFNVNNSATQAVLHQKLAPKDNGRQEKDFIFKERKEINLGTTSAVKKDGREIFFSDAFSSIHWASIVLLKWNLMETSKQQ